jgi:hypothetical protein
MDYSMFIFINFLLTEIIILINKSFVVYSSSAYISVFSFDGIGPLLFCGLNP